MEGGGGTRGKKPKPPHPHRRAHIQGEFHEAREGGEETVQTEDEEGCEEGPCLSSHAWGGVPPPPEENADLPVFAPESAHLLLQGVYGDFPHHNDGSHLDMRIADDAAWQQSWRQLADQSVSWYAMPSGAVGRRFTAILDAEWPVVLIRSWNSEIALVFAHAVLTKTLGVRRAQEIQARIMRRMDLWERG